jgi:hypothetical protein
VSKWLERARAYQAREGARAAVPTPAQKAQIAQIAANEGVADPVGGDLSAPSALTAQGQEPENAADAAAIAERAGVPREWVEGFARLRRAPPPASVGAEFWQALLDGAGHFLGRWAGPAHALGWTEAELFGLDPEAPSPDRTGGVLPSCCRVGRSSASRPMKSSSGRGGRSNACLAGRRTRSPHGIP